MQISALNPDTVREMVSQGKSAAVIGRLLNAHRKTIHSFVMKHNLGPWLSHATYRARPLPSDFVKLAATMPRVVAQKYWGCGADTLTRWYSETGIKPATRASTLIKATPDLAKKVAGLNIKDAAIVLGVDRKVASRVMREAGLWEGRQARSERPAPAPADNRWKFRKPAGAPPMPFNHYVRDMSAEGLAQACLQRDRWTVFRCDEKGNQDRSGTMWFCGGKPRTPAELLDRADRAAKKMGEMITWRGRIAA